MKYKFLDNENVFIVDGILCKNVEGLPISTKIRMDIFIKIASDNGWFVINKTKRILTFKRNNEILILNAVKLEVKTIISHHGKKNIKVLVRSKLNKQEIEKIFINPRVHTSKGKYKNVS